MIRHLNKRTVLVCVISFLLYSSAWGQVGTPFNQLVINKAEIEKLYGVKTLECFTFQENIGFDKDQAEMVNRCLKGVETLSRALADVPDTGITMVGISNRFIRTGGFKTILIPWNASKSSMADFLKDKLTVEEQSQFIDKILDLKKEIISGLNISELYCTKKIDNKECLQGYETLVKITPTEEIKKKMWRQVVVTDSNDPLKNPTALGIKFDATVRAMADRLGKKKLGDDWTLWRRTYRVIDEKYGENFRKRLQLPNFFCAANLTPEQCMQGASNLHEASADLELQSRSWGEVMIHKHNTFIRNDIDVLLRFDLPAKEIVSIFSNKPTRKNSVANITLAEKLESRTKNNSTGLRAVCDLGDLSAELCVKSFQTFISFVRKHPEFKIRRPWTEIMFIDGDQLGRVNFALNSSSRKNYIYIHANSDLEAMEAHLMSFQSSPNSPN
ncbi:MAG: hypothetical protein ACQ9MH_04955 [Nitrospinales bacterium]